MLLTIQKPELDQLLTLIFLNSLMRKGQKVNCLTIRLMSQI